MVTPNDTTPTAGATVRPFEAGDFDHVVPLMPPEWRFGGCTPEESQAQARMDFAGMLACCNERLVAVVRDETGAERIAGVLFARIEGAPAPTDSATWQAAWEEARRELQKGGAAAQRALAYEEQLGQRGDLIIEAAGAARGQDNELELFVVGPLARGKGAGSALMAAFERHLAEQGAQSYWLQTDSTCTWQWYEKHGYLRVADVALDETYPMPDASCCPENAMPAGAAGKEKHQAAAASPSEVPHVFMYRKNLAVASS